jgi:hypothetical protein
VNARALLTQLSTARLFVGAAFIAAPGRAAAGWIGADGHRDAVYVLARAFGARDAALGAGTLAALRGGGSARPWILAGLAADATDLAATLIAGDRIPAPARIGISAVATSALVVGALANAAVDDSASAAA